MGNSCLCNDCTIIAFTSQQNEWKYESKTQLITRTPKLCLLLHLRLFIKQNALLSDETKINKDKFLGKV